MSELSSTYNTASFLSNAAALPRQTGPANSPNHLARAATEFESVLLGQWLQSAEKSFATVPGGDEEEDSGGEQMMSFAIQQLASSIAASGGLGIARVVQRGLEKVTHTATDLAPEQTGAGAASPGPQGTPASKTGPVS